MVSKTFEIKTKLFKRRFTTVIQHKLRVLMKCYTVRDFSLDPDNQTFVFKKSHKINGLVMKDPKEYSGTFTSKESDNPGKTILILSV